MSNHVQINSVNSSSSTARITEVYVRRIGKRRVTIPSYQRGYRWTKDNVKALLDDLLEFVEQKTADPRLKYCLQPVIIQDIGHAERIVDGQQRITTLALLIYGLNNNGLAKVSWDMEYEELKNHKGERLTLRDILEGGEKNVINSFFVEEALAAIKEWMKKHAGKGKAIAELFDSDNKDDGGVFYIEYRFFDTSDKSGQRTFNEINDGQTPLTSSELIKALFIVRTNNKNERLEIAKEWELIEQQLRNPRMWSIWNTNEYDEVFTRIDLLFAVVCKVSPKKKSGDKLYIFHGVENWLKKNENNLQKLWEKVLRCFWWMMFCYENVSIFNLLGWIAWNTEDQMGTIYDLVWNEKACCIPNDMLLQLKKYIRTEKWKDVMEGKSDDARFELDNWRYDEDGNKELVKLLSFINILKANEACKRIPFEYINCKHDWTWQIEHINSKTENIKDKNLGELAGKKVKDKNIDTIENLALLDSTTNESYHNDTFPDKRRVIIEINSNLEKFKRPIMPCTLDAFSKMCADTVTDMRIWDEETALAYKRSMQDLLDRFVKEVK